VGVQECPEVVILNIAVKISGSIAVELYNEVLLKTEEPLLAISPLTSRGRCIIHHYLVPCASYVLPGTSCIVPKESNFVEKHVAKN
jgi:hypothetical protein